MKVTVEQITPERAEEVLLRCHDPKEPWVEEIQSIACYNGVGSEKFTASELYRCPNLSYNEDVLRERSIA